LTGVLAGDLVIIFFDIVFVILNLGLEIFRSCVFGSLTGVCNFFLPFTGVSVRFRFPKVVVFFSTFGEGFWFPFGLLIVFNGVFFGCLTFLRDVTIIVAVSLPFLIVDFTFFCIALAIRPFSMRLTLVTIFLLLRAGFRGDFLGVITFVGAGMARFFPIDPRQFSPPHLHICSLAPSNHEKL
jgi:hypothetical protein